MEKKSYKKPSLKVITLASDQMIATSNLPYGGSTPDTSPIEAPRMRNPFSPFSPWGNPWGGPSF